MWITRDKDSKLRLWNNQPYRHSETNCWYNENEYGYIIDSEQFENLTYVDEPIEVNLISSVIDEEKLNKMAEKYADDYAWGWSSNDYGYYGSQDGFIRGYTVAKEGKL